MNVFLAPTHLGVTGCGEDECLIRRRVSFGVTIICHLYPSRNWAFLTRSPSKDYYYFIPFYYYSEFKSYLIYYYFCFKDDKPEAQFLNLVIVDTCSK